MPEVRVHVYIRTTDTRRCPSGEEECAAGTDLGEWDEGEHSRIVAPAHQRCDRCGQRFNNPEGAVLMVPVD